MFSIPQPPPIESPQLPIIDVSNPSELLEIFLRIICIRKTWSVLSRVTASPTSSTALYITTSLEAVFEENPCIQVAEALGVVSSALYTFSPCHDKCIYNAQNLRSRAEGLLGDLVEMAKTLPWEN